MASAHHLADHLRGVLERKLIQLVSIVSPKTIKKLGFIFDDDVCTDLISFDSSPFLK